MALSSARACVLGCLAVLAAAGLMAVSPSLRPVAASVVSGPMDAAPSNSQAATLVPAAAGTTPPLANAGPDFTVWEDRTATFNGTGSTDDVGIVNYTWTFEEGSPQSLYGATPTYVFATPVHTS
ncbi:MAG TPA: PKD domain-containing protein [Thermoplasmata archaeon]